MLQVSPGFPQTSGWMPNRPKYEAKSTLHQTIHLMEERVLQGSDQGCRIGRVSCNASHVMQKFFSGYSHKSEDLAVDKPRSVYMNSSSSMLHKQQVISLPS